MDFFEKINPAVRFIIEAYIDNQNDLKNANRETRRKLKKVRKI